MKKIVLASQSPRRKQLMEMAEMEFDVVVTDVDETIPYGMQGDIVPLFLAKLKADAVDHLVHDAIVIAADTVVLLGNDILGKPLDENHAMSILKQLSGKKHLVVTGVCIRHGDKEKCFSVITEVFFRELTAQQIEHYVKVYKPYDKAGAYAIQEWIGVTGIEKINGDYYNVMGLPIGDVIIALNDFL